MIDRIGDDFDFYRQAIRVRHYRQEVLAANISNADTPNYKARDFDFAAALREVTSSASLRLPDTRLALTAIGHIPGQAHTPAAVRLQYRQPLQPSMDGNTVDMDQERVHFADNTLRYQLALSVVSGRIKTMMTALQQ